MRLRSRTDPERLQSALEIRHAPTHHHPATLTRAGAHGTGGRQLAGDDSIRKAASISELVRWCRLCEATSMRSRSSSISASCAASMRESGSCSPPHAGLDPRPSGGRLSTPPEMKAPVTPGGCGSYRGTDGGTTCWQATSSPGSGAPRRAPQLHRITASYSLRCTRSRREAATGSGLHEAQQLLSALALPSLCSGGFDARSEQGHDASTQRPARGAVASGHGGLLDRLLPVV